MKTPEQVAKEIVFREGGYVNDPDDPGGATKYGVTIGTVKRLGFDKNKDGRITAEDVKLLSKEDAINIFLKHYFYRPKIDLLPEPVQASVFDMYVNSGSNAIKILQRLLNQMGAKLVVDGVLGSRSIGACNQIYKDARNTLGDAYGIARRNYYFWLADKRPTSRKYARTRAGGKGGWIKRAEEFISPKYHLSDREFQARVSSWG